MFKILGYLLEFRNRASKGLIEVKKDFIALSKVIRDTSKDLKDFKERIAGTFDELAKSAKTTSKVTREKYSEAFQHRSWIGRMWGRMDKSMSASLASLVKSFTTFTASVAGVVVATKSAMSLQDALRDIQAQGGYTAKEMEGFKRTMISLSREVYRPFRDVGRVMLTLAKRSGMVAEEMVPIIRVSFKLGKMFQTNENRIVDYLIKAKALYGLHGKETYAWANMMITATQKGYLSFDQLLFGMEGMHEAIMLIKKDIKTEMMPSMMAGLAVMGQVFEDQPQQLSQLMIGLMDTSSDYFKQVYTYLKLFGGEAADIAKAAAKDMDLAKVMKIFVATSKLAVEESRNRRDIKSRMEEILGIDYKRIEAISRLDPSAFDTMLRAVEESAPGADVLNKRFTRLLTTSDHLRNTWYELMRQVAPIGEEFLKTLTGALKLLTKSLTAITSIYNKIEDIIDALTGPTGVARAGRTWGKLLEGDIGGFAEALGKDLKDSLKFVFGREPYADLLTPKGKWYRPEKEAAEKWKAAQTMDLGGSAALKSASMQAYKDMLSGKITSKDFLNFIRAQQDMEKARREKKQRGGIVFPQPGGVDVTVAEAGRPEVIADPLLLKRLVGSQEIVGAIWGSAHFLADKLKQSEKDRIEVTPRSMNITPTPHDTESNSYVF